MTKKLKFYLLIILSAICAACAFAGCKVGRPGREEVLRGYNAHVTYYSNGGYFNGSTSLTVRDLYFKNDPKAEGYNPLGVPFFDITEETGGLKVAFKGYDLVGWFIPAVYEDGEHAGETKYTYTYKEDGGEEKTVPVYPLLDNSGRPVTDSEADRPVFYSEQLGDKQILENEVRVIPSDTAITSDRLVADDENLIVCAKWTPSLKVIYKLACEEGKTYTDAEGNEYKNGTVLRTDNFGKLNEYSPSSLAPAAIDGATFVRTYLDESLQTKVGPITRPEGDVVEDIVIYSHYIDGTGWTIVADDSSKVAEMFNGLTSASRKYYLIDDVDCDARTFNLKNNNVTVNATIVGNGHTLYNLRFTTSGNVGQGDRYSIFGSMGANFAVSGLTLKDVSIEIKSAQTFALFAVSNSVNENAKLSDFVIDGITANVTMPVDKYIENAQNGNTDKWLFDGTHTSDEAFLETREGITVKGECSLTIKN